MITIRVIVTGSRNATDRAIVWNALSEFRDANCTAGDVLIVVNGACLTGVDEFAHQWCLEVDHGGVIVIEERHPAVWKAACTPECHHRPRLDGICPVAGPRRNEGMVAKGAQFVLGFPLAGPRELSKGTWNCLDHAHRAGIPYEVIAA